MWNFFWRSVECEEADNFFVAEQLQLNTSGGVQLEYANKGKFIFKDLFCLFFFSGVYLGWLIIYTLRELRSNCGVD